MNKTEQILKIIDTHIPEFTDLVKTYCKSRISKIKMAEDINSLFDDMYEGDFVELIDKDIIRTQFGLYYFKKTAGMPDMTLSEIHKYWLDNIKK